MAVLILALGIFIITHLLPAFPNVKAALIEKIGRTAYITTFSVFSLMSLGLIIYAKIEAPFIYVFEPPSWSRYFALTLMVPATILTIASILPGYIRKETRSPLIYATLLWVTAHLVANGDEAAIVLFGSLGAYACLSWILTRKQTVVASQSEKKAHLRADGAAVAAGLMIYVTLLYLHGKIIGVDIWY
jgi:uncharacterized membrane protein